MRFGFGRSASQPAALKSYFIGASPLRSLCVTPLIFSAVFYPVPSSALVLRPSGSPPIGKRALSWIARYVEHARDRLAIDPKQATLFLTIDGSPLNPDSLTEYGRRYIKAAGIDKPGACHIFRHTMATLMHDNGADIRTIQAILGHEKLDTTQIYTRVGLKKLLDTHSQPHPAERVDAEPQIERKEPPQES